MAKRKKKLTALVDILSKGGMPVQQASWVEERLAGALRPGCGPDDVARAIYAHTQARELKAYSQGYEEGTQWINLPPQTFAQDLGARNEEEDGRSD